MITGSGIGSVFGWKRPHHRPLTLRHFAKQILVSNWYGVVAAGRRDYPGPTSPFECALVRVGIDAEGATRNDNAARCNNELCEGARVTERLRLAVARAHDGDARASFEWAC